MNVDILKPSSQFAVKDGSKVLCLTQLDDYAIVGTARGQVLAYHVDRLNHSPIECRVSDTVISHLIAVGTGDSVLALSSLATLVTLKDGAFLPTVPLPSSTGARLALCTTSHIIVAVKKALLVYTHSGVLAMHLPLKEKARALSHYDSNHIVIVSSASLMKLSLNSFKLTDINIDKNLLSSSYFGQSSLHVFACDNKVIIVQDTSVVLLDDKGNQTRRIVLAEKPVLVGFLSPIFMAIIYENMIEVYAGHSGDRLQVIHTTTNPTACGSVTPSNILVGLSRCLSYFSVYPLDRQIQHCMLISGSKDPSRPRQPQNDLLILGLDMAVHILQHVATSDPHFKESAHNKFLAIRDKFERKAMILFNHYHKYHDLLVTLCSLWLVPVYRVLDLFPDILNTRLILGYEIGNGVGKTPSRPAIKNISANDAITMRNSRLKKTPKILGHDEKKLDSVEGVISSAHETTSTTESNLSVCSDTLTPFHSSINPLPVELSETYTHFVDAVTELIVYLTDQRRIHLSFLNAPFEVHNFHGFRISAQDLYHADNLMEYMEKITTVIDTSLFLCYYYVKPMLLGPFLRLTSNRCDSSVVTRTLIHEAQFTSELLDFYCTRELDGEALKTLRIMADTKSHEPMEVSDLTVRYLQRLDNSKLALVFEGASWLIERTPRDMVSIGTLLFMNDSTACEGYDPERVFEFIENRASGLSLAVDYLEWVLFENLTIASRIRDQLLYKKMSSYLAVRYIEENPSKALEYLESTEEYDPIKILASIDTEKGTTHLLISALLHKRCGEYSTALDIYYKRLDRLDRAMQFCQERYAAKPEVGTALLHQLFDECLARKNSSKANADVTTLLGKHGLQMDVSRVLKTLPETFPLSCLQGFLLRQYNLKSGCIRDMLVRASLLRLGTNTMYCEKVQEQARCVTVSSPSTTCHICHRKLGTARIAVEPRGDQPSHYGCVDPSHL